MTENERYYTTKIYLDKLANGMNPLTGEDLPEDTILNEVCLCRAFSFAASVLDEVIRNGCRVRTDGFRKTMPFCITDQQRGAIVMSETPVSVSIIARRVERVLDKDVRTLSGTKMAEWLEAQGLLRLEEDEEGRRRRVATEEGERLGIKTCDEIRRGEKIVKNVYDINAQAFLIANLTEIAEFTDGRINFGDETKEKEEPGEAPQEVKKKGKAKKGQPASEPKSA